MSIGLPAAKEKSLHGPELSERLQELRRTDNVVNWWYLARSYAYLVAVIGAAVWFDQWRAAEALSWLWSVPAFAVAVLLVGAGQHQLSGLAHEGAHHILFRTRRLNEFASDWFCLFPLFSSTHHYRLQHLAHHQFVNDPDRDPDVSQLQTSGHWLSFPVSKATFLKTLLAQLWLPNLVRFMLIRAKYNATGTDRNPYMKKGGTQSKTAVRLGLVYILALIGALTAGVLVEGPLVLAVAPAALWAVALVVFAKLPDDRYHQSRVHPVFRPQHMTMLRITFITLVFGALAWAQKVTGVWAWAYYALLWVLPVFTSFSFFMILRQLVQHGNGDRGKLTNTRAFFVGPAIRFAVFPMGQEYHLPHHLYATVPHYRLKELHRTLMGYAEYREQATEVHGYFASPERPQVHPTVLDVLGPDYVGSAARGVHIDNSVLDGCKVDEKDQILAEGDRLQAG